MIGSVTFIARLKLTIVNRESAVGEVNFIRRISVLMLLAFWLAATQHCGLEASGIIPCTCQNEQNGCASKGDLDDGCHVVEHSAYKLSGDAVKVPAPELAACDSLLFLRVAFSDAMLEPVVSPVGTIDRPFDWITRWQFARRAALPSRAPSVLCA